MGNLPSTPAWILKAIWTSCLLSSIAPICYAVEVVGDVASASLWTNAYGQADLNLLAKAAAFLGHWIANSRLNDRLKGKVDELAFINKIGLGVGPTNGLEDVFSELAKAFNHLILFQRCNLTWVDPEGTDISVLHWAVSVTGANRFSRVECHTIGTSLDSGKQEIGALSLERDGEPGFTAEETRTLERLTPQIAHVVHNMRLYQHVARQALQIEDLKRAGSPINQTSLELGGRGELTVDTAQTLRTPLTAIKGYSSALIQLDANLPPEIYREFLEAIDLETDRLNQVLGELSPSFQNQPDAAQLDGRSSTIEILFDQVQADLGLAGW